jgi:hypothetical protein
MAGPIGNYPYSGGYGQSGYYSQGMPPYNAYNTWASASPYGDYSGFGYGGGQGYYAPPSFSLFPSDMDTSNNQFYDAVVDPNLGPVPNAPPYTPNASSPQDFYDTVIDPSVHDAKHIYDTMDGDGTGSTSDDMASFNDSMDNMTQGISDTYNQHAPEANNRRALEILTANDDEALKKIDTMGKHDGADHKISSKDLQAALEKYHDQFTDEQKWAIQWMYQDHGALWDWINGRDSKATFDEIHDALNSDDLGNH